MSDSTSSNQSLPSSEPSPGSLDLVQAVWQLRILVCGLGAMLLVLSLAFNLFVWKQNRNIVSMTNRRLGQISQLETRVKVLAGLTQELATYSAGRPELIGIFNRHGLELKPATNVPSVQP